MTAEKSAIGAEASLAVASEWLRLSRRGSLSVALFVVAGSLSLTAMHNAWAPTNPAVKRQPAPNSKDSFEVFPHGPADPTAAGVSDLHVSRDRGHDVIGGMSGTGSDGRYFFISDFSRSIMPPTAF
jgi:hypothetical protein